MRTRVTLTALAALLWTCCAGAQREAVTAFIDVQVVPMDRERVLAHQTVLVRGTRIAELGPVRQIRVPAQAVRVAGGGSACLLPGLADMHTHVMRAEDLLPYTADGVTTLSAKSSRGRAPICCWFQTILYNPSKRFGARSAS